jgi:hypothetical protein
MDLKETGYQNFAQWRVLTNPMMNFQFLYETGVFLDQFSDCQLLKNSSAMSRWALGPTLRGKASKPEAIPPSAKSRTVLPQVRRFSMPDV